MIQEQPGETRDGSGSGDHDTPFAFGNPRGYLTLRAQARLLVLRGLIQDHRSGVSGGAAEGDVEGDA